MRGLAALLLGLAMSTAAGAQSVVRVTGAEFTAPTERYQHGVLGDATEWGALVITFDTCPGCAAQRLMQTVVTLPEDHVFEDLEPRLIDLDGDGSDEVVVVETDMARGAALAVYDSTGKITETPHIGRAFRWLAPLGAAEFFGDGDMILAYIDRPHLAKTLRLWRYRDGALSEELAIPGLTNHRIGEAYFTGGIADCGSGPEIITADAGWRRVISTRFDRGTPVQTDLGPFQGKSSVDDALACRGR